MTAVEEKGTYIGDGVYLSDDGWQLTLAVNDHRNIVAYLEPGVMCQLIDEAAKRQPQVAEYLRSQVWA